MEIWISHFSMKCLMEEDCQKRLTPEEKRSGAYQWIEKERT